MPNFPFDADEKAVSLSFLFRLVMQKKGLFISITMVFVVLSVVTAWVLPNIYRSKVVMIPTSVLDGTKGGNVGGGLASLIGSSSLQQDHRTTLAISTLKSRLFLRNFINKYNLMPVLYPNEWGEKGKEIPPLRRHIMLQHAVDQLNELRKVSLDIETGNVSMSVEWTDPVLAKDWVEAFIYEVNRKMQNDSVRREEKHILFLQEKIAETKVPEVRNSLSILLKDSMKTLMLASSGDEYAFHILDPAEIAAEPVKPKRKIIVLTGGMLGVFGALLFIYMNFLYSDPRK